MVTNIEYLHADQIGGCVTLISTETTKNFVLILVKIFQEAGIRMM